LAKVHGHFAKLCHSSFLKIFFVKISPKEYGSLYYFGSR